MRSGSVSSISSASSRASSAGAEETMQIFVKNIAGDSKRITSTCSTPSTDKLHSLPNYDPRINLCSQPPSSRRAPHKPSRVRAPPRLRRQASRSFQTALRLQRLPRQHPARCSTTAWRRSQEDPLRRQGLQGCCAADCRRLWVLPGTLLWEAPNVGEPQLHRTRGLQEGGEG